MYVCYVMIVNPLNKTNMIRGVKELADGAMRYYNVRIEPQPSQSFPEMVVVRKGPKRLSSILGKRYVNLKSAVLAIDEAGVEYSVRKEGKMVLRDLTREGLVSFDEI